MHSFPVSANFKHKRGMRYLFLNIDGVLHPMSGPYNLCLRANVLEAVKRFDFKVVISSDWRAGDNMENLKKILGDLGTHVVGMTPLFYPLDIKSYRWLTGASTLRGPRHLEIEEWLFQHTPGDSDWFALDSNTGQFIEGCQNVYFTDPDKGFNNLDLITFKAWCHQRLLKRVAA